MVAGSQAEFMITTPEAAAPPPVHLEYLDSLRALAALWVVLLHAAVILFPFVFVKDGLLGLATHWLKYGHLAVDIFIVLSGFCLIIPVARTGCLKGSAGEFYARRARRILPPYYAALGLSLVIGILLREPPFGLGQSIVNQAVVANLLLLQDMHRPITDQINPPLWSVALEWQIYFLFPALVWSLRRYGMALTLSVSAILGYGLIAVCHQLGVGMSLAYSCPWYIFLFTLGICAGWGCSGPQQLALKTTTWWVGLGSALMVVLGLLLWKFPAQLYTPQLPINDFERYEPLIDAVAGALTATMLILLSRQQPGIIATRARRLLAWQPLVWLGTMTYSIYLLQWPLLRLCWWLMYMPPLKSTSISFKALLFFGVALPVMGGLCYIFFMLFERPFLNKHKRHALTPTAPPVGLAPAAPAPVALTSPAH